MLKMMMMAMTVIVQILVLLVVLVVEWACQEYDTNEIKTFLKLTKNMRGYKLLIISQTLNVLWKIPGPLWLKDFLQIRKSID